jgi:hypothetical protein
MLLIRSSRATINLLEPYFTETDSLVSAANWADLRSSLPGDLMVKVDVASMARGPEIWSPLLDHVLMAWAAGIPAKVRMARGVTKALQIGRGTVPAGGIALSPENKLQPQFTSGYGIISGS